MERDDVSQYFKASNDEEEQNVELNDVSSCFGAPTDEEKQNVVKFIDVLYKKEELKTVAKMGLDTGRANYSARAIKKLLPYMKKGKRPDEAVAEAYPDRKEKNYNISRVGDSVVQQALRETMQAIDYAIHKHGGLPTQVVVELSRDMKLSQKKRGEIENAQKAKKKVRDTARKDLEKVCGITNENTIKKYIFWKEQKERCTYCGKTIALNEVCSTETEWEHIVPKKYGGQNFHANLAVAHKVCNQKKKGMLPLEAFGEKEEENVIRDMSEKMSKPNYLTKPFDAYKLSYQTL